MKDREAMAYRLGCYGLDPEVTPPPIVTHNVRPAQHAIRQYDSHSTPILEPLQAAFDEQDLRRHLRSERPLLFDPNARARLLPSVSEVIGTQHIRIVDRNLCAERGIGQY